MVFLVTIGSYKMFGILHLALGERIFFCCCISLFLYSLENFFSGPFLVFLNVEILPGAKAVDDGLLHVRRQHLKHILVDMPDFDPG